MAVLVKSRLFANDGYVPHQAQTPIHSSPARHKVAAMGRRTGKSTAGGKELFVEATVTRFHLASLAETGKRREFWIVGPEYTDSEKEFRTLWNTLKRHGAPMDKPGSYYDAHSGDMQVSMYGGKFLVIGKSAKHEERLVGEGLDGVIMAEAAKLRERVWAKYIRPTLADTGGWSIHNSTPEGKNWFYESWMKGQSTLEPDWMSWRMPSWYNTVIFPGGRQDPEILALERDLSTETFNQEIAALFTDFAGRVFKDFDEEVHVRDFSYNPAWPAYGACDYGFTNPFVWLLIQVDPWGSVYVVDEMYERGLTIDEAAIEISARGLRPSAMRTFYPDPASPGDSRLLEQKLKLQSQRGTGGEIAIRLRIIRAALKERNTHLPFGHVDRTPRLFINRRCTHAIQEMNDYRYPEHKSEVKDAPEAPLKKDDHVPEALGRFMVGMFGHEAGGVGPRVSTADVTG